MKGLFRKDLYVLRSMGWLFILLDLSFALIPDLRFFAFAAFYTVMLAMALAQTDEQSQWDTLLPMLPVSRRQVVLEKYLAGWGYMGLDALLALAGQLVWQRIGFMPVNGAYLMLLCLYLCLALVVQGIVMPILFRFGTARGRIILGVSLGAVMGVMAGIVGGNGYETVAAFLPKLRGWHLLALGAALSALSIPLSLAGYRKRIKR